MQNIEGVPDPDPISTAQLVNDPYRQHSRRQWWLVCALTLAAIMAVIDRTILSLLFDPIKQDLQFSDTQMAMIFGFAFAIANVAFTLPAGLLADRISRRGLIATGAIVWSVMTSTCGVAMNFWQLLLARAGVGFAEGVIHPCSWSMLRSALPEKRRGRGFAVYSMAIMTGSALGFIVGGVLIKIMSDSGITHLPIIGDVKPWRLVMLALGVIGLPFSLLMLTVYEPVRKHRHHEEGSVGEALAHMGRHWRIYIPLIIFSSTLAMQSNAYGAFLASIALRRWNLPVAQVGSTLGILMLCAAPVGSWITGVAMDRLTPTYNQRAPAIVGVFAIFIVFITSTAAPVAPSPFWFYVLVSGLFTMGGAGFAITGNLLALITPARNMGKTSAIQLFVYGLIGMGSGPAIVGVVSDRYFPGKEGIATAMSWCCGAFTLTAWLTIWVLLFTTRVMRRDT